MGRLDTPLTYGFAVDVQSYGASFCESAAVIVELGTDLMFARPHRFLTVNLESLCSKQVVAIDRFTVEHVKNPAAEGASLGDYDPVGFFVSQHDLGGNRMALVLDVDDAVLGEPTHAAEQQLRLPFDQGWPACGFGVEPFDSSIVEWQHVVAGRFDEKEPLELRQLLRHIAGNIMSLGPVVGCVQLPDVFVD